MKNRYIPFGYQIQNGDSVINTEQAATVQHIFYAYTEGQSFKEIAEYLTTSGTAYHFSDNSWNKNIVARILANEIYCGAKGYPAIISKEVYSQAASIRSNKTVTYSAVLKPFRSDMQCACCGERLYWRPRTQQWTCRQCGMWSKPMQPENMAQQIVDRLYQIQQHPEIIHNPKEQCNTRSIEVAQLDHEIHTALALPELDADAIIDKILRRAELQFNYCAAGDDDPTTMQILQNEKYCGDVLLQKTFIEDVLTGVSKKNTGQLPQYYIENNHEGIVTKQMFREVQAEIARRNSKSAANQRKRHQGRYNSKYALSERLVCGDCGSPYKRVTWNIHGRKQIVWRCVNRLEYGTKFCSHSPSIPEEELHQAILKAVQNLAANFTDEVAAQLDGILRQMKAGENLKAQLQKQLEKAQQEFDRLLEMSLELDESTPFLDDKLRKLSGKIKILKANIAESTDGKGEDEEATKQLTAQDLLIKEYDDILTARIIEKVIVHSRQEIEIYFIGGYTQKIDLI